MPTVKREDTYDTQDGAPLRPQRERRLPRAGRGTAARAYDITVLRVPSHQPSLPSDLPGAPG